MRPIPIQSSKRKQCKSRDAVLKINIDKLKLVNIGPVILATSKKNIKTNTPAG